MTKKTLAFPIVFHLFIIFLSGCTELSHENHAEKGAQYFTEGKLKSAELEYKNAIAKAPNLPIYRSALGSIYITQGFFEGAEKEFLKSLELGYKDDETLISLSRSAWHNSNIKTIEHAIDIANKKIPSDMRIYYALALLDTGHLDKALDEIKLVNEKTSLYTAAKNRILIRKNTQSSLATIDTSNPENPDILFLSSIISISEGHFEKSIRDIERFITLQPRSSKAIYLLVYAQAASGDLDRASKNADKILAFDKNNPVANLALAYKRFTEKNYDRSLEHAEIAISRGLDTTDIRFLAALNAFNLNLLEKSYQHVKAIEHKVENKHPANKLKMLVENALGYHDQALISLSKLTKEIESSDLEFIEQLAFSLIKSKRNEEANKLIDALHKTGTENPLHSSRLGMLQLMTGDKKGIENLKKASKNSADLPLNDLTLAMSLINSGELDQPRDIAFKLMSKQPNRPAGYLILAAIHQKEKKYQEALKAYDTALELAPKSKDVHLNKIALLFKLERDKEATISLNKALENTNYHPYFVFLKIKAEPEQRFATLEKANIENPGEPIFSLLLSNEYYKREDFENALNVIAKYQSSAKGSDTPDYLWKARYNVEKSINPHSLDKTVEDYIENSINKSEALHFAVAHYLHSGRKKTALDTLERHQQTKESGILMTEKANILIDLERIDEAEITLKEAISMRLEIPEPSRLELLSKIHLKRGDSSLAIKYLKNLKELSNNEKHYALLASAYEANGEPELAIRELYKLAYKDNASLYIKMAYASTLSRHDKKKAQDYYAILNSDYPDNIYILNNFSNLLLKLEKPNIAFPLIERAYNKDSKNPIILDTLANTHFQLGNRDSAIPLIEEAYRLTQGKVKDINDSHNRILMGK